MNDASTFWTRRIAAVQAEAETESEIETAQKERAEADALVEKEDTEILAELGLPDPGLMQQGDDFAAFMSKAVPEHLRRQALRTLWRSNPVLACVDGLNDYDEDFTKIGVLSEPLKTAYQVGKGMTAHIREMERLALKEAEDVINDAAEVSEAPAEQCEQLVDGHLDSECVTQKREDDAQAHETVVPQDGFDVPPAPRRMRFQFQEATA
ncbi:MAG: DUF3306 domain-containing protein [Roseobacter sp.]